LSHGIDGHQEACRHLLERLASVFGLLRSAPTIAQPRRGGFGGDSGRQIGEILLQLVTQLDLHERRDDGKQRAAGRGSGSASENQHETGAYPQGVDQVIQFVINLAVFGDKPQASRPFNLRDPHLFGGLVAEHDPLFAQSRAGANRAGGEQFDTPDRTDDLRPFDDVGHRLEGHQRAGGDGSR
jgi:hypothetical protein